MKTAVEILKAARALIEKRENWAQEYYAKTAEGDMVDADNPRATCFCSFGAIEKVTGTSHDGKGWPRAAVGYLQLAVGEHVPNFNDEHTHEEVLAMFDKAIELAEKEDA